jgi:hypothetical protein
MHVPIFETMTISRYTWTCTCRSKYIETTNILQDSNQYVWSCTEYWSIFIFFSQNKYFPTRQHAVFWFWQGYMYGEQWWRAGQILAMTNMTTWRIKLVLLLSSCIYSSDISFLWILFYVKTWRAYSELLNSNFRFLCINKSAHGVYISQLINFPISWSIYDDRWQYVSLVSYTK